MNRSDNLLQEIHLAFSVEERDIRSYSPLKLAYLGDAVFEIIVRTLVMEQTGGAVKNLHKRTSTLVNAGTQAELATAMREHLTEEEQAVYRRGRNAKSSSVARHADIHDYRSATGLEALFGYLYLCGRTDRAVELLRLALEQQDTTLSKQIQGRK